MKHKKTPYFKLDFETPLTVRSFKVLLGGIKETISGGKWEWHKNDEDHMPSFPHLHGVDNSYKIDVYSGYVYDSKCNKVLTKISKKDFKKIWNDKAFIKYVYEKRELYYKKFYDNKRYKDLPPIPSF